MNFLKNVAIAALVFGAAPLAAKPYTLSCEMIKLRNSGGYIPHFVTFVVDEEKKTVSANYRSRKNSDEEKIDPEFAVINDKRITFAFVNKGYTNSRGQWTNFNYRGTWLRKNDKFRVVAKPLGYANKFSADGVCKKS